MAGFGIAFVLILSFAGIGNEEVGRFDTYYGCYAAQAMERSSWRSAPYVHISCKVQSLPQLGKHREEATSDLD